jgi:hypothetical protein
MACIARSPAKVKPFPFPVSLLKLSMKYALIASFLCFFLSSCSGDSEEGQKQVNVSNRTVEKNCSTTSIQPGCKGCHSMELDSSHELECTICHNGNDNNTDKTVSHEGLIRQPAHPDHMAQTCGQCHEKQVEDSTHSLHFTLKNEVNRIRYAFGATNSLQSLTDIPISAPPVTILNLADDLLRRRCLRCHPYFSGDRYPAIVRGTGCASCHLNFYEGKLVSHSFMKTPGDTQCLQCHYGNWVGSDYYGRYEHDMNDEYRTPYTTTKDHFRPFGIEFHQLNPDIHQQNGLICVDCHGSKELMSSNTSKIHCSDCHDKSQINLMLRRFEISLNKDDNSYMLLSKGDGKQHTIPFMKHPAHQKYNKLAGCQVCHAQWSFNDQGTHLLRNDMDEYDDFSRLTVQGSFEIEQIVKNNLDIEQDEIPHSMSDKITGEQRHGLWYKGYEQRRWEQIIIGRDDTGRLQVMRPLLDLYLSWIDEEEEVHFNSIKAATTNHGLVSYVPHTTGQAGLFYATRIKTFLDSENKESNQHDK